MNKLSSLTVVLGLCLLSSAGWSQLQTQLCVRNISGLHANSYVYFVGADSFTPDPQFGNILSGTGYHCKNISIVGGVTAPWFRTNLGYARFAPEGTQSELVDCYDGRDSTYGYSRVPAGTTQIQLNFKITDGVKKCIVTYVPVN